MTHAGADLAARKFDKLTGEPVCDLVGAPASAEAAKLLVTQAVVGRAKAGISADDVTVIVVDLNGGAMAAAAQDEFEAGGGCFCFGC